MRLLRQLTESSQGISPTPSLVQRRRPLTGFYSGLTEDQRRLAVSVVPPLSVGGVDAPKAD
jgi:hypothetical protein